MNLKRILRLYRRQRLKLRAEKRRRVTSVLRAKPCGPTKVNQCWSLDFVHDTLSCGRRFRALNIIDVFSRECLAAEVDTSLTGERVVCVLEAICRQYGYPAMFQTDNGTEFTGRHLDEWAHRNLGYLHSIEPGKPNQNSHIESFNGRIRDECLTREFERGTRDH